MNSSQFFVSLPITAISLLGIALAGCSGPSGSGPTPTPTSTAPTNRAPSITSAAAFNIEENGDTAYQATATDADGDAVTMTLSGPDAARFAINATGQVRFAAPPNFEKPTDADGDNVYALQLVASDGKTSANQNVAITVTNNKEGVSVQRIATGFDHPAAAALIPGGNLMIAERSGAIYVYNPTTQARTLFASVEGLTNAEGQGIIALAVHPTFNFGVQQAYAMYVKAGRVTLRQVYNNGGAVGLAEFAIGQRAINSPDISGWVGLGPTGALYAATPDAGGTNDPTGSAQNPASPFGKLLLFSVSNLDIYSGASVPPPITTRVLASGLHNPSGATFYDTGGPNGSFLFLPDRGQSQREEMNSIPLSASLAQNLGWPYREGTVSNVAGEPAGLVSPLLEYPRSGGPYSGQKIIGGSVYQGSNVSLNNQYLFLDASGAIFTVPLASFAPGSTAATSAFERRDADFTPASGTITQPVAVVRVAPTGYYIVCDNGDVFLASLT